MIPALIPIEVPTKVDGINRDILDRKIDFATAGIHSYIHRDLTENVSPKNALMVAEYILEMKTENNLSHVGRLALKALDHILTPFLGSLKKGEGVFSDLHFDTDR